MYIQEAIHAATDNPRNGPFIRRKCWPYNWIKHTGYKIRVTVAPSGCIVYSLDLPPEKWVPKLDELTADDWETCL